MKIPTLQPASNLRSVARIAFAFLLFLFLASLWTLSPAVRRVFIRTVTVKHGVWEISGEVVGRILRSEELCRSPIPGSVTPLVRDGDRVEPGTLVFEVNDEFRQDLITRQLESLKSTRGEALDKLEFLDTNSIRETEIDTQVSQLSKELTEALLYGDSDRIQELKQEIAELEGLKARSALSLTQQRSRMKADLEAIEEEITRLEESLQSTSVIVRAKSGGIVAFSPELDRVIKGAVVCRIVDTKEFFLEAIVPLTMDWKPKDVGKGHIEGTSVSLTVLSVHNLNDGRQQKVRFRVGSLFPGALSKDEVAVYLTRRSHTGQVIPAGALVHRAENPGVYVMRSGVPVFQPVKVLAGTNELIVEGLSSGDEVVSNPWLLFGRK